MVIKETAQLGNKVIRTKAKKVQEPTSKAVQKTVRDLIDSMRDKDLVGMAAPQIGKSERIFVTEVRETKYRNRKNKRKADPLRVFINPKITSFSQKEEKGFEGCGSVLSAGLFGEVQRSATIEVDAFDEKGERFSLKAKGLLARIIQHEMDHINGVVFVDKANPKTFIGTKEYLLAQK
jgi:peptide deformylase